MCIFNHGTKLRRSVVTEGREGFVVISHRGSGCLGLSRETEMLLHQEGFLMLGAPAGWWLPVPGCVRGLLGGGQFQSLVVVFLPPAGKAQPETTRSGGGA